MRICLVGTGAIAHAHAEAIQNIPRLQLTTVVDTDDGKAREFAARWGVACVHSCIEEALKRRNFDRAHVAVSPDAHAAVTSQFARGICAKLRREATCFHHSRG